MSFKKQWINALRSGKYQQHRGRLCRDDRHCCLGVGCEILVENKLLTKDDADECYLSEDGPIEGALDSRCRKLLGIDYAQHEVLIDLNDYCKYDFNKIADKLEEFGECLEAEVDSGSPVRGI